MLYITIIIVAILIIGCIITCNYFYHYYNPNMYAQDCSSDVKLQDCLVIVDNILSRIADYNEADEKDKYMYSVSEKEIESAFNNIKDIIETNNINPNV